jgi:transcriptional regulator with XRE-family HTH domain
MLKRGDPKVLRLVVKFLRSYAGEKITQEEFGQAAGLTQASLSKYELGEWAPPEETLRRMAEVAGVPWPVVVHLRRFYAAVLSLAARRRAKSKPADTAPIERAILDSVLLAVTPHLVEQWAERPSLDQALREAAEIWEALKKFPPERRRRLIELNPRPEGNAALARTLCEASARAAAADVEEAKELAGLALFTAHLVPGGEAPRNRAVGFCLGFVSNAQRVATEFDTADSDLAGTWGLWRSGEPGEPDFFPAWRLYDLEASLRREQHRFPEALECVERAFELCGGLPEAAGHILLKKEHIFDAMGDREGALAALEEAAPFVEASGDLHQLFFLRYWRAKNLCAVERYSEAAEQLPAVRQMAIEQGMELNRIRVAWLSAKVDAGLGRPTEAKAGLEQVRQDFKTHDLPYEAALSSLDLAILYLKEGRTAEVKALAVAMGEIFEAKRIAREALAALTLFCEAAKQETATVELAKRVMGEVERAQRKA